MAKFAVGDTVRLTRGIESNPVGTIGTVERVDDYGWIMVAISEGHTDGYYIMVKEQWGDLEKIEDELEKHGYVRIFEEANDEREH